jgi:hypothetical protein
MVLLEANRFDPQGPTCQASRWEATVGTHLRLIDRLHGTESVWL